MRACARAGAAIRWRPPRPRAFLQVCRPAKEKLHEPACLAGKMAPLRRTASQRLALSKLGGAEH
eukprot:8632604-Alexandrium_andersonii.AAC.1